MKLILSFDMDNSAFDDETSNNTGHMTMHRCRVVGDILGGVARKFSDAVYIGCLYGFVRDDNGNTIGNWEIKQEEKEGDE